MQDLATQSVFVKSCKMDDETAIVKGYEFNNGVDFSTLMNSYKFMGFQATNLANAIEEINKMVNILSQII